MNDISGFKMDKKVKVLMDRFEDIVTEVDKVDLETNLKYAFFLQFVDRLEKSSKISNLEILRLKDTMEDVNRAGKRPKSE